MEQGFGTCAYSRVAMAGTGTGNLKKPDFKEAGFGYENDQYMNEGAYLNAVPKMFEMVRKVCGDEVELLHDVHERVQPMDVINMIKQLETLPPLFH